VAHSILSTVVPLFQCQPAAPVTCHDIGNASATRPPAQGLGSTVLFMQEHRDVKVGFNAPGETFEVSAGTSPRWASTDEIAQLGNMSLPDTFETNYLYIDKATIEAQHDQELLSDDDYNAIQSAVSGAGLMWGDLPNVYESYSLSSVYSGAYQSSP
jgi:hypothetical protein